MPHIGAASIIAAKDHNMPAAIDTQHLAEKIATQRLLQRITDYAKINGIEHTISDRILPILNVGPLHTLTPHQLRIVLHLLHVVAIYPPHGARA